MAPPWLRRLFDSIAVTAIAPAPTRRDWLLFGVLAALFTGEVIFSVQQPAAGGLAVSVVGLALLPWRRRIPLAAALIVCAGYAALLLPNWGSPVSPQFGQSHWFTLILLCYAMARWTQPGPLIAGSATVVLTALIGGIGEGESLRLAANDTLLPWVATIVTALAMRHRAQLHQQHTDQVVANARLAERQGLARELHDLVAHHVSAIAVIAQAAQVVGDTQATADTLRSIERTASTALLDLRRLVGILRDGDTSPSMFPDPDLVSLVDPHGVPAVTLVADADLDGLPTSVRGAVYRITQEAITNARRHGRHVTAIDVSVRRHPLHVEVEVTNDGGAKPRGTAGFGLVGMRERVEAFGGAFSAGPQPAGGWAVRARIPVDTAVAS